MQLHYPQSRDIEEWQVFLWNLPEDLLKRAQKIQLMAIIDGQFNSFDPFLVVRELLEHRSLWQAVVMDRGYVSKEDIGGRELHRLTSDLIKLRDLPEGHWNVDTLFVLVGAGDVDAVQKLAEAWHADEVFALSGDESDELMGTYRSDHPVQIVTVWWD